MRKRVSREQASRPDPVYSTLEIGPDLRVRPTDPCERGDRLYFQVTRYSERQIPGKKDAYDWWYDSDNYGISVRYGARDLLLMQVTHGRIRECAFSGNLSPEDLWSAMKLLSREGFGEWVLPGLQGVCKFHCALGRHLDPDKIIGITKLIHDWQRREVASIQLPPLRYQRVRWEPGRRKRTTRQQRFGKLRINQRREVRLSSPASEAEPVFRTVHSRGSWEGLWWYDEDKYAIYVESRGIDVFSFYVENGRATDAAFAPALDVRQFNATAELLNREGFGGWILHALRKTLWFLGSQHIPDAKKIAAVASMLLEWQARGSKPVDLP